MNWEALLETRRLGEAERRDEPYRNPFQADGDRVVFSRPFRRLQQKTQVHPLPADPHVRNRLVHTLEVASVGRSLGYAVGSRVEPDLMRAGRTADDLGYLVQATCLAHDIGNPPFGHAGEEAIADHMADWLDGPGLASGLELDDDLRHFDGNAQGFRVLASADGHRGRGGLRLTVATLAAFLKYPWPAWDARATRGGRPGAKFNAFATEGAALAEVAEATGLPVEDEAVALPRHPAAWLMEAADDLVYTLSDLEDAVELGVVRFSEYAGVVGPVAGVAAERLAQEDGASARVALLRSRAVGVLVEALTDAFLDHLVVAMEGLPTPGGPLVSRLPADLAEPMRRGAALAREALQLHPRNVAFEIGARDAIGTALDVFLPPLAAWAAAGGDEDRLPGRARAALTLLGDYRPRPGMTPSEAIRCAVDCVAGMTDSYAGRLSARLRGLDPTAA